MSEPTIHKFNPREFVKSLPRKPGVYCMLDANGEILYVGKARALQARVSSYFRSGAHDAKTQAMDQPGGGHPGQRDAHRG